MLLPSLLALDGQISAVELKNEISSLLFRCLNGTNANIRYRTVKKEHEKTWTVSRPKYLSHLRFSGKSWRGQKTAGKIYNSPSASGGIGVGGGEGGDSLVRFMMCLSEWKRVPCDAMNKERDGKCLFASTDSSRLRSRASEHV